MEQNPQAPQEQAPDPPASPDQGTPEHEEAIADLEARAAAANAAEMSGTPPPEPAAAAPDNPPAAPADEEG